MQGEALARATFEAGVAAVGSEWKAGNFWDSFVRFEDGAPQTRFFMSEVTLYPHGWWTSGVAAGTALDASVFGHARAARAAPFYVYVYH